MPSPVHVVGGGLAGSEAAWQLARRGVPVVLHEMRPIRGTEAHKTDRLAELVCSNSFRSDDALGNAVGLLHEEMRRLGSLIMAMGDRHKLPAGGALAVDREGFAAAVTEALAAEPWSPSCARRWSACRLRAGAEPSSPPAPSPRRPWPRTSEGSAARISSPSSTRSPRSCTRDSIDLEVAWFQSRYDKEGPGGGTADYINCPMDREQYDAFLAAAAGGREGRVQGVGARDALLRGLPADRGHGRARAARPCASGR